jgi:uncharacterized membrane protein
VTVIGYTSTLFGSTDAFFTTARIAAFAASYSWPPPSQFLLYVTVNCIAFVAITAEGFAADEDERRDAFFFARKF